MRTKKMLAILASPRKHGNLAHMLEHAVKTAESNGYEVHYIWLYEKEIKPCTGCMYCRKANTCCLKDDIKPIEELLKTSDLVVMASPTYFDNVSAPAKNLFDRLVSIVMNDNDSLIPKPLLSPKQQYLLMTTCNTPFPFDKLAGQSTGTLRAMKEFFNISGMTHLGNVTFAGTRNKTQVPPSILHKIERKIISCSKKQNSFV